MGDNTIMEYEVEVWIEKEVFIIMIRYMEFTLAIQSITISDL